MQARERDLRKLVQCSWLDSTHSLWPYIEDTRTSAEAIWPHTVQLTREPHTQQHVATHPCAPPPSGRAGAQGRAGHARMPSS